ncbi:MAG: biotin-dependent carboxyltransferase family protein [Jatrophihabitantaceae bacterium]
MLEVLAPGPLATVQDGGRHGYADLGVARSGAFDRAALRASNRLVGNDDGAAAIELTLGGLVLLAHDAATIALTGAPCTGLDAGAAITLPAGAVVRLGAPASGLRSYLAVRGGLAVPTVLGSRSTDTLSGLGPAPLREGERLRVGSQPAGEVSGTPLVRPVAAPILRVIPGPRDDWFTAGAMDALCSTAWTVRPDSNRIGVRLDGPALPRVRSDELASEPTLPGALQVPPDGRPILLGPDAPVTGGYPVIAVVRDADLDAVAQARAGDRLRFVSS